MSGGSLSSAVELSAFWLFTPLNSSVPAVGGGSSWSIEVHRLLSVSSCFGHKAASGCGCVCNPDGAVVAKGGGCRCPPLPLGERSRSVSFPRYTSSLVALRESSSIESSTCEDNSADAGLRSRISGDLHLLSNSLLGAPSGRSRWRSCRNNSPSRPRGGVVQFPEGRGGLSGGKELG